jgi:hypothetical protein
MNFEVTLLQATERVGTLRMSLSQNWNIPYQEAFIEKKYRDSSLRQAMYAPYQNFADS